MRGERHRQLGLVLGITAILAILSVIPVPAAPVTVTVPYSPTAVSDSHLDGDPATGAWSDAGVYTIPLENGASSPYGSATLYAKHDGTYAYFRIDGKIDVLWQSASGNHFWVGMFLGPSSVTGHHQNGQDGVFFGDSSLTSGPPLVAVDTDASRPPGKDASQDDLGAMRASGSAAPYDFTAEWKRKLDTGDTTDVVISADGTTSYYFSVTTDSNGGGSGGGSINHKSLTNDNVARFAVPQPPDTTPPIVTITSPTNAATLSGTVLITATATDNVGVTSVDFLADGTVIGTDMSSPYERAWDTTAEANGPHQIAAKAFDGQGNTATDTIDVTVDNADRTPPAARAGPDQVIPPGSTVTLDGSASTDNIGIVTWTWSLTDSGPVTLSGEVTSRVFNNNGAFLVTLTVADAAGNTGTDALWVNVTADNAPPVADAGPDRAVLQGTLVTLDGRGSTDDVAIANFTWTFADSGAIVLQGPVVTYRFLRLGDVSITLTVQDFVGNSAADTAWVNVSADTIPPVAEAGPDQTVRLGDTVGLNGSRSTDNVFIAGYVWRVEGTPDLLTGALVTYVPRSGGVLHIVLTVTDASGLDATDDLNVTVLAPDRAAPAAPAGVAAVPAGPGAVRVDWTANAEPDLAGYLVYRSEGPDGPFIQLNAEPISSATYLDVGVVPGRTYTYLVRAVDTSKNLSDPSAPASGASGLAASEPFDWLSIRWAAVPGFAGALLALLAILAWREVRRKARRPPSGGEGPR